MILIVHIMNYYAIQRNMQKSIWKQVFEIDTCGWWLCNPEYDTGDGAAMQIEMISACGQLEVEDKENGKYNAVRPQCGDLAE